MMKIVFLAIVCIACVHCQGDMTPMAKAGSQELGSSDDENAMLGARRQGFRKMKKFRAQEPASEASIEPKNTDTQRNMYHEIHANPAGFYVRAPANHGFRRKQFRHGHGPVQPAHLAPQKESYGPVQPAHLAPQKESYGPVQPAHLMPSKEATPAHHPAPAPAPHYPAPAPAPHYHAPAPAPHYPPPPQAHNHYARPVYHAPPPHHHHAPSRFHHAPPPAHHPPQPHYAQPRKSPGAPKYAKRHNQMSQEADYVIPIPFELPPNPYCGACQGQVPQPEHQKRHKRVVDTENITLPLNDGPHDDDHYDHSISKRSTNTTNDPSLHRKYDCYASDGKKDLQAKAEFHFHVNEPIVGQAKNAEVTNPPTQPKVRMSLRERLRNLKLRDEFVSSTGNASGSLQDRFRKRFRNTMQQFQLPDFGNQTLGQAREAGAQRKFLTAIGDGVKSTVQKMVPEKAKAVGDQKDTMISSSAGPKANRKLADSLKKIATSFQNTGGFVGSALSNLTARLGSNEKPSTTPEKVKANGDLKDTMVSSSAGPKGNQKLADGLKKIRTSFQNTGNFVGSALSNLTANLGSNERTSMMKQKYQKDTMVSSAGVPKSNRKLADSFKKIATSFQNTGDFVGSALSNLTANLGSNEKPSVSVSNVTSPLVGFANPGQPMLRPLARVQNMMLNLKEQKSRKPLNLPRLPPPQLVVNPQSMAQARNLFRNFLRPQSQHQPGIVGAVQNFMNGQPAPQPGPVRQNINRLANMVGLTTTTTVRPDPPLKKMRDDGLKALKTTLEQVSSVFQPNENSRLTSRATSTDRPVMVGNSKTEQKDEPETLAERIARRKKERQEAREARKEMVAARHNPKRGRHRHGKPALKGQSGSVEKSPAKGKDDVLTMSKDSPGNTPKVGANLATSVEKVLGAVSQAANRSGQQLTKMISNTADRFAAGGRSGDQMVGNTAAKQQPNRSPPKVVDAFAKILNAVASSMEDMTLRLKGDQTPVSNPAAPIVSPFTDDVLGSPKVAQATEQVVTASLVKGVGASAKIRIPELVLEFPASASNTVKMVNDGDSIVGNFHTGQGKVSVFNPHQDVSVLGNPSTENTQDLLEVSSPMHESHSGKHKRGGLWAKRNRKLQSKEGSKEAHRVGNSLEKGQGKKLRKVPKLDRVIVNPLGATDDDSKLGAHNEKRPRKGSREFGSGERAKLKLRNRASNEASSGEKPGLGPKRKNFIKVLNKPKLGETAGNKKPPLRSEKPKWLKRKQPRGRNSPGSKEVADIVKQLNTVDEKSNTGGSDDSKPSFESESQSKVCEKCKQLGGLPGQVSDLPKTTDSTLKKEERPLIVLPDHLNPDKKVNKTTEKPKSPATTVVVTTKPTTYPTTAKPKEATKPNRPMFRSYNDLSTSKRITPFRYTNVVASPRQDKRVMLPKPSPLPMPRPIPRPMLMDMPPRIQYTKLDSSENLEYPPVFYADPKPESIDYLVSIEDPVPGTVHLVAKRPDPPKKVKKPMLQDHNVYLPTIEVPPADGRYHEFPTQPILPEPYPSSPYDLPFDNPPEATSLVYYNHIVKEMPQPTTSRFKPTFQESLYDFCGCSSQLLINPEDFINQEKHHDLRNGDCRITLNRAKQFVGAAIEDYSKCCKDCRHKVIDTVAAKMEDLEHNSDMCEYFNAAKAGPYVSKVCQFQNHRHYESSTGPKIRQINMNSFPETTPSSPMTINEPTYEALATIFDPVTVPYKTTYTQHSRPSRSPATESPEAKLQRIVDQLRQVLTETVFQKYTTDATTAFVSTLAYTNATLASSPMTTAVGRKTWVLSSGERSSLLASLISNERVKDFLAQLKVLKRQRQPEERNIDVDNEEASNFVRKLVNKMDD